MRLALTTLALLAATPALALDCAEGERAFTDARTTQCIPASPHRIVSLHDMTITLTLLELGASMVGSMGRLDDEGNAYIRGVDLVLGLDFENSGLTNIGAWDTFDYEVIARLAPDLIIGRADGDEDYADRVGMIAPSVFIAEDPDDAMAFARGVADAGGVLAAFDAEMLRYEANIARARAALPEIVGMTMIEVQAYDGLLYPYSVFGGSTKVLLDLGLVRNPLSSELLAQGILGYAELSAEALPQLEADFVFDNFTIAYGETFRTPRDRMAEVLPSWCDVLAACNEDRFIILVREHAAGFSFRQLDILINTITANLARIVHRDAG